MGQAEWLEKSAQQRVERAIAGAELKTAAEFVVTVRQHSGHYRAADLLFGSLVALVLVVALGWGVVFDGVIGSSGILTPATGRLGLHNTALLYS